jgi:hypothetical protein
MKVGGNLLAHQFFDSHGGLNIKDAKTKYSSHVAMMYREHLQELTQLDYEQYGETVHVDGDSSEIETQKPKNDFFHESHYASVENSASSESFRSSASDIEGKQPTEKKHTFSTTGSKTRQSKTNWGAKKVTIDLDELAKKAQEEKFKMQEQGKLAFIEE